MRATTKPPIVIAAGGTGGHFFPAEALAAELLARGERVVLMTDARSGGLASPVFARTERHVIAGAGLSGRSFKRAVSGGVSILRGVRQARKLLRDIQPGAIVAFGGYPSVAPICAGFLVRPRPLIVLHEQNAVLGRANRFLSRMADFLLLSFETTQAVPQGAKTRLLGNPVRPAIAALHGMNYSAPAPGEKIEILVLGGSLGAKIFGALIPAALALLPQELRARLNVTQQCRADDIEQARIVLKHAGIGSELSPFFADVAARLGRAHLVIARAGASTVAELAAVGRPAILIPLPNAIDDHQRANADALAMKGAAWRLDQTSLTPEILAETIKDLLNTPEKLATAAAAAATAGRIDAVTRLADLATDSAMVGGGSGK